MWVEIGKTVRHAIKDWGSTWRMVVCVASLTVSVTVVLWATDGALL
ncbi:hypothetical protein BJY24_005884 [Nocardia transvalensis]|uniref:Uncharacterized protein n=1 Tax=Nocardia transvalensis TaxID=37333 RepID=A0A7W9PIU0_9NOCA|nr:hypothetical protein [Nocardia transvalensis]